tara:strand:+ start:33 stop:224 length:192 start_codon:yes stop_codon:yes gene_type:complete
METLDRIVFEMANNNRKGMISIIQELSKDEYENINDVFELAKQSKKQLRMTLKNLYDYYTNKI